ncbi:two pore domain potassium channel family protein [Alcaligenaceae bacterium]|nr:two pore domain potassium channel family protein [Alcaligenaceae bacterium]
MYESRDKPLLHPSHFRLRIIQHIGYAMLLLGATLFVGALGHRVFSEHNWHDSLMSAAFVIGGIGNYAIPETYAGKIFSVIYGFFVSMVVMATVALLLAPIAHRIIHKFHLDEDDD